MLPSTNSFKDRLGRVMIARSVSQSELARGTGMTFPAIHNLVTGKATNPKMETVKSIAEFLNVPANSLLDDDVLASVEKASSPFSLHLRELMQERRITAYRLAKLTGISHPAIIDIINGRTANPQPNNLQKIANALGLTVENMVYGTNLEPKDKGAFKKPQESQRTAIATQLKNLKTIEEVKSKDNVKRIPVPFNFSGSDIIAVKVRHSLMAPDIQVGDIAFINIYKQDDNYKTLDDGTLIAAEFLKANKSREVTIGKKITAPDGTVRLKFDQYEELSPAIERVIGQVVGISRSYAPADIYAEHFI
jgi:transcriptional regulator with XRE-family HTH domain